MTGSKDAAGMSGVDGPRNGEFASFHRVLTQDQVPPPGSLWPDIANFALSFDAYAFHGTDPVAAIANKIEERWHKTGELPDDLVSLRTALFFLQRYRRDDLDPSTDDPYLSALLEAIRVRAPTSDETAATGRPEESDGVVKKDAPPVVRKIMSHAEFRSQNRRPDEAVKHLSSEDLDMLIAEEGAAAPDRQER